MTMPRWTLQAVEDLEAIRVYIARDSEHFAVLLVERLVASVERLGTFPESGRIVPELQRPDLRELIVGSYRVVYRLSDNSASVLTVLHGARLFPEELGSGL